MMMIILVFMKIIHLERNMSGKAYLFVQGDGNADSRRISPELYNHGINHVIREE